MPQSREKIVVTGGAGFIGSHLVDRLLADSTADLVVIDNLRRGRITNLAQHGSSSRLQLVQADICDVATLSRIVEGASVVYHLAAQTRIVGDPGDVDSSFATNATGTFNVLSAAVRNKVKRVVFTSSREVYGEPVELPVQEGQPLLAINMYGASKIVGEAYCRAFRHSFGLQSVVLRLANVYGPRDFGRVIPTWIDRAAAGEDLYLYGGKQILDFVWIDQAVEALVRAGNLDMALPPINVGSGVGMRLVDVARRIALLVGGRTQIKIQPARAVEVVRFVANVERMRQLLELEPSLDPLSELQSLAPLRTPIGLGV
jgi:UDP-glucose 4-epimerase